MASFEKTFACDNSHVLFAVNSVDIPSKPFFTNAESKVIEHRSKNRLVDLGGCSIHPDRQLFSEGKMHGFIEAVVAAFSNHYPLALRPQHIWLLILQAVAEHVSQNAEELRSRWVAHEGKKDIIVLRDEFIRGKKNDWAGVILEERRGDGFLTQIEQVTVEGVMEDLLCEFSDTTMIEKISLGVTVMDTLQHYFNYIVRTRCGFPFIILEGTLDDWILIRTQAEQLISTRCTTAFKDQWCPALLPLLDKFVEEYRIAEEKKDSDNSSSSSSPCSFIDEQFWQSMCKRGGIRGSGGYNWLNGWFNIFFPFLTDTKANPFCVPYSSRADYVLEAVEFGTDSKIRGVNEMGLPSGISTAPVMWEYHAVNIPLSFHSGFTCARQDPRSLVITPHIGWYVVDPSLLPQPPQPTLRIHR